MTVQEPAWQAAEAAIEAHAPEASEFGSLDMAGWMTTSSTARG